MRFCQKLEEGVQLSWMQCLFFYLISIDERLCSNFSCKGYVIRVTLNVLIVGAGKGQGGIAS